MSKDKKDAYDPEKVARENAEKKKRQDEERRKRNEETKRNYRLGKKK